MLETFAVSHDNVGISYGRAVITDSVRSQFVAVVLRFHNGAGGFVAQDGGTHFELHHPRKQFRCGSGFAVRQNHQFGSEGVMAFRFRSNGLRAVPRNTIPDLQLVIQHFANQCHGWDRMLSLLTRIGQDTPSILSFKATEALPGI
jgi:hypothetical protein